MPKGEQASVDKKAQAAIKCVNGHEKTLTNWYADTQGKTRCRKCRVESQRRNKKSSAEYYEEAF